MRLREVRAHNAHHSMKMSPGGLEYGTAGVQIQAALTQMYILSARFESVVLALDFFSPVETASVTGKTESTTCSTEPGAGEELGVTTWQRFLITKQHSLDSV